MCYSWESICKFFQHAKICLSQKGLPKSVYYKKYYQKCYRLKFSIKFLEKFEDSLRKLIKIEKNFIENQLMIEKFYEKFEILCKMQAKFK